jgi:hypothetical protein
MLVLAVRRPPAVPAIVVADAGVRSAAADAAPPRRPSDPDEAAPPVPVPPAKPLTEAEKEPKRRRGVEILSDSITRREERLREAQKAGDTGLARELEVEIERLKLTRDRRARELGGQ